MLLVLNIQILNLQLIKDVVKLLELHRDLIQADRLINREVNVLGVLQLRVVLQQQEDKEERPD
jgi:hypothetical protein